MAEPLQNQALFKKLHIALLFFVIFVAKSSYAQSLLLPGDIVFVTVNASSNSFEFVPLIDLEQGTEFKISNGDWNNDAQNFSAGQFVTFIARNRVKAGTPIKFVKNDPSDFDFKGSMDISDEMEALFIYQEDSDVYRFIFGIGWGTKKGRRDRSFFGSDIPNVLKENPNAFLSLGNENNYQYFIRNGASGTPKMILDFITNASYWRGNEDVVFNNIGTSFNLLESPVILFDESLSSINENDKTLSLNVAIYEHDGSKLTVDVIFDSTYSSVERSEIKGFRKKQINFTGLIGDAVYEIELSLEDDKNYEGIETGIFNLSNLSNGKFGDFISHTAIFLDDEIPELKLELTERFDEKILLIHNLESIEVDLGNWELVKGDLNLNFARNTILGVGESLIVMKENDLLSEAIARSSYFLDEEQFKMLSTQGTIQLKDFQGRKIVGLEVLNNEGRASTLLSESVNTSNAETQTRNANIDLSSGLSKEAIPGWKTVIGKDINSNNFSSSDLYTWDENSAEFLKVGIDINSISDDRLVVGYFDQSESEILLDEKQKVALNETLSFNISATDSDENGRIDGTEGLNLIQNNSSQIISVGALINNIKNKAQLQDDILAFRSSPDFSSISLLEDDAIVFPGQLIWIRLGSELEATELELNTQEFLVNENIAEEIEKGNIELEVVGNSTRSSFKLNFLPEEIEPDNKQNFKFRNALYLNSFKEIVLTGSILDDHFDIFEISNLSENITQLPLNFAANKSGEFELRVNKWTDIPDGWVIKIEDLKDDKSYELDENWSLKFNYSDLSDPESKDEYVPSIEERFVLKVIPEGLLVEDEKDELPVSVELHQNYPNPFNPSTTISFYMPEEGTVKLSVFNIVGQPVAVLLQETKSQGEHTLEWDASDMPSGIYIYQLEVGTKIMTRKMTLVK